ncbi:MAG: ADP-ribosyltransferase, partial [Candidatus Gastranaerophilaceae bacterium]
VSNYQNKANELQNQIESSKIELSYEEQYAINQYISSESYILNETLREELELTEQQKTLINNLDKALDKFPKYEGYVTRSIMLDENTLNKFLKSHKVGKKVKYKAYTSATVGTRYNDLSNVELHIKSKSGIDIRKYNKEEQEILFKRNSCFKVDKIKKINNVYYIFMEEIDG